ncbi:hypothetical protein FRC10_006024 [Ceratobasidium sp. 414]|nr:hypothetical protein FRC10_006024 [Ceratobasidium sp. 414]
MDWSERTGKAKKGWWGRQKTQGVVWESDSEARLLDEDEGQRMEVPEPKREEDCVECYAWDFGDYMNDTLRRRANGCSELLKRTLAADRRLVNRTPLAQVWPGAWKKNGRDRVATAGAAPEHKAKRDRAKGGKGGAIT